MLVEEGDDLIDVYTSVLRTSLLGAPDEVHASQHSGKL
jgi:hypothetical protein